MKTQRIVSYAMVATALCVAVPVFCYVALALKNLQAWQRMYPGMRWYVSPSMNFAPLAETIQRLDLLALLLMLHIAASLLRLAWLCGGDLRALWQGKVHPNSGVLSERP